LETAGQWKLGASEISTRAKAQILTLRAQLSEQIIQTIEKKNPRAAAQYRAMNERYSNLRSWIDDVAIGTRDEKIDSTVKRLVGGDGGKNISNMQQSLSMIGLDGQKFVDNIFQRRAALNSSKLLRQPTIGHMAGAITRTTSPQRTTPLLAKTFNKLQGVAKMNNFVADLSPMQRRALLKSPDMMMAIRQITAQAIQGANDGADMLVQQALEQSQPSPTPLPPPDEKAK
jgi:hypothetical protein